ncbi:MAG: S8 family serine peptidase [Pseudomonadales bacterium]|nr:S8 family serine peptidase [Pseudomonadales bacterium]
MSRSRFLKRFILASTLATCASGTLHAATDRYEARGPSSFVATAALRLENPISTTAADPRGGLDASLLDAEGEREVIIRLAGEPTTQIADDRASARLNRRTQLLSEQAALIDRIRGMAPGMRVIAQVQHVLNAVFVAVPADVLPAIAQDEAVVRVVPVGHYELDLSETVPKIGASVLQAAGLDGTGVSVAVLDSGVDYTHADLGGSGDPDDYLGNDGTVIEPGTFPTAKVVGGFDFLGNVWQGGADPILPDPDPLDDLGQVEGAFAGHGTHVADIIGGVNGVAPGVDLYAVKVCASLSPACNGIALIQGMEFVVDPNGDGDTSDHLDIANLSLGASYGQPFDDDLSTAIDNATALGVLTVSSAGNCGDQPYCTGTPSAAPTALSVAQTEVPSATRNLMAIVEPAAGRFDAPRYTWTPAPTELVEGPVLYGVEGNVLGCDPFTEGSLDGAIVLVDRGICNFSQKIRNIQQAGGTLGIIGLVEPGAPFAGAFGGGDPITIPGYNIGVEAADILRQGGATVQFGPELIVSLDNTTASTTARGPDMSFNALKPEIAAPGASVSADVATGTGRAPFGGTSGASPMVAGAAALLQQSYRQDNAAKPRWLRSLRERLGADEGCKPLQLKALLMNNAFPDVVSDTTGRLAEITRVGAGEVRVDAARNADFWAYVPGEGQPSISLGFMDVAEHRSMTRWVRVVNRTKRWQRVEVVPSFRFPEDAAADAVRISVSRDRLLLPPRLSRWVRVKFEIDPVALGGNFMNSGNEGNVPANLTAMEFDGHLVLRGSRGTEVSIPWHVLPRKAAAVAAERKTLLPGGDSIALENLGAGTAQNSAFTLVGLSDEMPRGERGAQMPMPDLRAVGVNTIPVPPGVCTPPEANQPSFVWQFALNSWDRQTHLMPVSYFVVLDTDQDGIPDFIVLNRDETFNNVTAGRQLTWSFDLSTGAAAAQFFAEHATNTNNTVLTICAEQVGLSAADLLTTNVDVIVEATDFYNGGPGDAIGGITITPFGEGLVGLPPQQILGGESGTLDVLEFAPFPGNSPELGVLLNTNADFGVGNRGGATEETEALLFLAEGVTAPVALPQPEQEAKKAKRRKYAFDDEDDEYEDGDD